MKSVLEINCDNSAFGQGDKSDAAMEASVILKIIASMMSEGFVSFPQILDSNGNNVGSAEFVED